MTARHPIKVVCHRGANQFAPENTYASSQICIDWGMDVIEIDVNSSNDGVLYLLHGPELETTTEGHGVIMAQLSKDIDHLHAGYRFGPPYQAEPLPRLEDYLLWAKGKAQLFLDVKFANLQHLVDLIRRTGWERDCFFWFGLPELARTFRHLAPDLRLKVNADGMEDVETAAVDFRADIIETSAEHMSPTIRDACRSLNMQWMIYYQGCDPHFFRRMIKMQPDYINTNYGDRLLKEMQTMTNSAY
jgi:glycerophosphoryl diester phosphodiesterase